MKPELVTPADLPRDPARRRLVAACLAASFALYALTAAPGVLWQDSAMFQLRVWQGDLPGVIGLPLAHPLYVALAWLWTRLPLGDFAFRVNLFSSLCGAVALTLFFDLVLSVTRNRIAAVCGAILLGVSHTFWWHAVVAEVYDLYALALLAELWLLHRFFSERHARWLVAAAFVNGLNLSNHLLAMLHWPAYACLLVWALRRRRVTLRDAGFTLVALLVGMGPYLGLIAARWAAGHPLGETLKEALVGPPQRARFVLTHEFSVFRLTSKAIQYFALNFPTPLAIFAPVGLWACWKDPAKRWLALFGGGVFAVAFVFAFRYVVPDQFAFYTPCYVLFALFAALGLPALVTRAGRRAGACIACALLPALIYEAAPDLLRRGGISIGVMRDIPYRDSYAYFLRPRKNGDTGAERFAREALAQAAPDGLLMADVTISNVFIYLRDVKGVERGVTVGLPADVEPAAPATWADDRSILPFVRRGAAYLCTGTAPYVPRWIERHFDLEPAGPIFRVIEKKNHDAADAGAAPSSSASSP